MHTNTPEDRPGSHDGQHNVPLKDLAGTGHLSINGWPQSAGDASDPRSANASTDVNSAEIPSFFEDDGLQLLDGQSDLAFLFGLEPTAATSDGYQSTPSLTPSWTNSPSETFASAMHTPELDFGALPDRVFDEAPG
ncbi:hypothetical protein AURDEDRAFT_159274 [Auricularia subglabra TFB-10046 SS5]|nr:hypothetical protein AURDEDRAFT_159274 [Auricularia subglabra TFB-10046 SS5]